MGMSRSKFTFLVDRVLCMPSVKFSLLKRFRSFQRSLSESVANEVRVLAVIVGNYILSTTGLNMSKLAIEFNSYMTSVCLVFNLHLCVLSIFSTHNFYLVNKALVRV